MVFRYHFWGKRIRLSVSIFGILKKTEHRFKFNVEVRKKKKDETMKLSLIFGIFIYYNFLFLSRMENINAIFEYIL